MSGLEKAIRNALAQSERNNADIRARIYHSARQALDAGLRKQDVTDPDLVEAQKQRLEAKIREIEFEERQRLAIERSHAAASEPESPAPGHPAQDQPAMGQPSVDQPSRPTHAATERAPQPLSAMGQPVPDDDRAQRHALQPEHASPQQPALDELAAFVGTRRRDRGPTPGPDAGSLGDLGVSRNGRAQPAELRPRREIEAERPRPRRWWQRKNKVAPARPAAQQQTPLAAQLDIAAGKEGRPRKRRRWISGMVLPLAVLAGAGWAVWWAGNNGLIALPDMSGAPIASGSGNSQAPTGFEPGRGFSEDWVEIFIPKGTDGIVPAANARVEAVQASGGEAVRVTSQVPGPDGEVAIDVPPEILREMAGKTSTVAVTLQTAADRSVEVAVRCDFGSLGGCSRHRFKATQEKTDALFRVNFDRSLAPNRAGRIYLNSDVLGGKLPIYVFSMRILPGQ